MGRARGFSGHGDDSETFYSYTDFTTPSSLYFVKDGAAPRKIKSTPEFFNPAGMQVEQFEAESADGTMIPYFLFTPKGFDDAGKARVIADYIAGMTDRYAIAAHEAIAA